MAKPHILDDNAIYSRALIQNPFLGIYMQGATCCPHSEPWPPSGGTWQSQKQCLQVWIRFLPLSSSGTTQSQRVRPDLEHFPTLKLAFPQKLLMARVDAQKNQMRLSEVPTACDPSTWEDEAGGLPEVRGWPAYRMRPQVGRLVGRSSVYSAQTHNSSSTEHRSRSVLCVPANPALTEIRSSRSSWGQ